MIASRLLVMIAVALLCVPRVAFADHLQGRYVAPGETVQGEGEFYSGDKLQNLLKRLLEADAMEEKIASLEQTVKLQEAGLKEFRERRDLTEAQRKDFEALQKSYELHLQIYRDAIGVYRQSISDLSSQVKLMVETNKELSKQLKGLHRELFWTRALGTLGVLGVAAAAFLF